MRGEKFDSPIPTPEKNSILNAIRFTFAKNDEEIQFMREQFLKVELTQIARFHRDLNPNTSPEYCNPIIARMAELLWTL